MRVCIVVGALLLGACTSTTTSQTTTTVVTTTTTAPVEINLVAVGDISCGTSQRASGSYPCKDKEVANVVQSQDADYALLLGDIQYPAHGIDDYYANFKPNWEQVSAQFIPVLGNHEYDSNVNENFFAVWGSQVPSRGYYTVDLGIGWVAIVLNSERVSDEQTAWLEQQLIDNSAKCVIVAMHHPRFSSGVHGDTTAVAPWYDPVPQFVVGTGGKDLRSISDERSSAIAMNDKHGVLSISIINTTFRSYFIDIDGATYDGYSTTCTR